MNEKSKIIGGTACGLLIAGGLYITSLRPYIDTTKDVVSAFLEWKHLSCTRKWWGLKGDIFPSYVREIISKQGVEMSKYINWEGMEFYKFATRQTYPKVYLAENCNVIDILVKPISEWIYEEKNPWMQKFSTLVKKHNWIQLKLSYTQVYDIKPTDSYALSKDGFWFTFFREWKEVAYIPFLAIKYEEMRIPVSNGGGDLIVEK